MGRDLEPVSNPVVPYGHEEPRDLAGHFAGTWGVALSSGGHLAGPSLGQREKLPFVGRDSPTHTPSCRIISATQGRAGKEGPLDTP